MRKKILQIILVLVAFCQLQTFAQNARVTGKVIGPDNNPVAGASVTVSGTNQGTVTDADGNFAIVAPSNASLLINSIGFTDQVIKIDGRSNLNVTLASGNSAGLEEVVVTGYTAQKKKDIVGSVAVVDVKALKAVPSGSALQALQGQAAGVNVINSGSPGATSQITVRGITSFGQNLPLVLIDGIQGNINDVPATDVESMQVLKDAGAASIYGARGANGVIIITTKRGKSGVPSVVYDSYYNFQMPRSIDKLDLLGTEDWARGFAIASPGATSVAGFRDGNVPDYYYRLPGGGRGFANEGDPLIDPDNYSLIENNKANNSYIITKLSDKSGMYEALTRNALMMQHNVTASGGNDRANYLLSLGYLDHEGTVINSFLRRYNVRINSSYKVRDNIRVGQNLNIQYKNNIGNPTLPGGANISTNGGFGPIEMAIKSPSFIPVYDIAGNWAGPNGGREDEIGEGGNPVADATERSNNRARSYGMVGNVFLEVDILKDFTARTVLGGSIDNYFNQIYSPRKYWNRGAAGEDAVDESSGFRTFLQWTNTLNYKKQFGLSNLNVLVGSEAYEDKTRNLYGRGVNYFQNDYRFILLGNSDRSPGKVQPPSDDAYDAAMFSLFGRLDYSYNDKYLMAFTIRRDGYSDFGSEKKYGVFPSISLGWRISQESFMKNVSWINDLKIRGSYGEMGNKENVRRGNPYNQYNTNLNFSFYPIGGGSGAGALSPGFFPRVFGNAQTSWETNKLTNIGFDATLFNNKLDLSVEYYNKEISGLLFPQQVAATAGEGQSPSINFGDMSNKGVDIVATYRARLSKDVNINVGANFTTYKSRIVALPEPGNLVQDAHGFFTGFPVSAFYGYKVVGIFKEQRELDEIIQQEELLGRYRYEDVDGDGEITPDDRQVIGDPNPDFTLGLNLGVTFKNFDINAMFYSAVGQDINNGIGMWLSSWEKGVGAKNAKSLNDAWSPENPDGNMKKLENSTNFSNSAVFNSAFIEKGSYVRLRNLQIGYTFQGSGLKSIGLSRVRAYVGGTNLFLITKYSGLDPEVSESGVTFRGTDAGAYIPDRGVVLGLNVTF